MEDSLNTVNDLLLVAKDRLVCSLVWTLLTDPGWVTWFVALYTLLLYRASWVSKAGM